MCYGIVNCLELYSIRKYIYFSILYYETIETTSIALYPLMLTKPINIRNSLPICVNLSRTLDSLGTHSLINLEESDFSVCLRLYFNKLISMGPRSFRNMAEVNIWHALCKLIPTSEHRKDR